MLRVFCLMLAGASMSQAMEQGVARARANPIRKVVTMLQAMQKKVEEEGAEQERLFKKFMCYCTTSGKDLKASIEAADSKAPELDSDIKAGEEQKSQLEDAVKQAKADRKAAKDAMAEATSIREKEAAAFAEAKAEASSEVLALKKAIAALEKGMAGSFLQTPAAQIVKRIVSGKADVLEGDRRLLTAFLSGSSLYSPQGVEVVGILKQVLDTTGKDLMEAEESEATSVKNFDALMAAKKKEVSALTQAIEEKTQRAGELAVKIVQMKDDLSDTQKALLEDKKFLAQLEKGCGTATEDWETQSKTRQEELLALAETIKVLNDDDALELFKKTLPSAGASSFLQVTTTAAATRSRALASLKSLAQPQRDHKVQLDLISLALHGKTVGFEKVTAMIDEMVTTLGKGGAADEKKKEYCEVEFDTTEDDIKSLQHSISDTKTAIATTEEGIATAEEEMSSLETGIKRLDESVAEATNTRKEEHAAFTESMAANTAAKQLIEFAKNRMNKFYNPKLYLPPPKQELSPEDQVYGNFGGEISTTAPGGIAGTGITVLTQDAPPPPPEGTTYSKKAEESNGVIAMMDLLIADVQKELTESKTEEKDAQGDYEQLMKDSAEKRALDSKTLTSKASTKADLEAELESLKTDKASSTKELMATGEYMTSLHKECDWLLQNFEARKQARASEMDALKNAKAVLAGADYALLQTKTHSFLAK